MVTFGTFVKGLGNVAYNSAVLTPLSIVKGLVWIHCFPSHLNYLTQMERSGFAEKIGPEAPFWEVREGEMNSQPDKKELFNNHYFGKIFRLGEKLVQGREQDIENAVILQHFVALFSGISAVVGYKYAFSAYGSEALVPMAITTGLSLIHELRFNKKLKNLDDHLYEQPRMVGL